MFLYGPLRLSSHNFLLFGGPKLLIGIPHIQMNLMKTLFAFENATTQVHKHKDDQNYKCKESQQKADDSRN